MLRIISTLSAWLLALSWVGNSHFLPWTSWHSEAIAFLAVFLLGSGALVALLLGARPSAIVLPVVSFPFLGLGLIAGIQGIFGLVPFWGDIWAFGLYMALCVTSSTLGFAAASATRPNVTPKVSEPFMLLASVLVIGALASALIAFLQIFGVSSEWIWDSEVRRPGSNLGQPNHLATLLVMGIASVAFIHRSKKLGGLISILLLILLELGIAATESRAGALSFGGLLVWWLIKRQAIGDRTPWWVGMGAGIVFVGMFWAWPHLLNAMGLLSYRAEARMLEGSLRLQVWPQLLEALAMHPWTGWGINQVAPALNTVADKYAISEPYTYSHNVVLDLALWIGVPLALLYVCSALIWFMRRIHATSSLLPWYGLAVALPLILHSMLEYPHAYAYFLAPVLFLLGAVEAATGHRPNFLVDAKPVVVIFLTTIVILAWSVVEYLKIEEDFRLARYQALRIGSPFPEYQRPRVILFSQLDAILNAARITPSPNMSPDELHMIREAAQRYPWSATQYRYALALALNGNPVEGARQFQVIRRMWGEKIYQRLRTQVAELATTQYPVLHQLDLP